MRQRLLHLLSASSLILLSGCSAASPTDESVAQAESQLGGSDGGASDASSSASDAAKPSSDASSATTPSLVEVSDFGANPGALKMFEYVPAKLATKPATVLVLHGCNQHAADVAKTGWNDVADALGFVVVYPEQVTANNQALCFNWGGVYGDMTTIQRGKEENQSIKDMVDKAVALHTGDAKRIFVVGFSAGGGEAAVMAAAWPEVFAGAATIAGIPYHCNTTYMEAFSCQKPGKDKTPAEWATLVREAHAGYTGSFPRMSIWQGASDSIVSPTNRNEMVEQWTEVHKTGQTPAKTDTVDGANHSVFKDSKGNILVETYEVPGMDHGVAVAPPAASAAAGSKKCGVAGQYSLDKGICTAARVATFFGLDAATAPDAGTKPPMSSSSTTGGAPPASKDPATAPSPSAGSSSGAPPSQLGSTPDDSAGATCAFSPATTTTSSLSVLGLLGGLALLIVRRSRKEVSR